MTAGCGAVLPSALDDPPAGLWKRVDGWRLRLNADGMTPNFALNCTAGFQDSGQLLPRLKRRLASVSNLSPFLWFAALMAWPAFVSASAAESGSLAPKLIEYGWDVPTPAQMQAQLTAMEERPFDGVIFRLEGGHNAFVVQRLEPSKFVDDERILGDLRFTRFLNNFVLIWGSPPPAFDWFDDAQWRTIESNARLLVQVAQAGRVRGICFDPEPYDFSLWEYAKQPRAKERSFAEYRAKVRQRGAELMRAFEDRMPGATILTFFHVSLFDRYAALPESEQARRLERKSWGLMPDFFVGMLEGATPSARFIDGNENALIEAAGKRLSEP